MGWSSTINVKDSRQMMSWKVFTNWGYVSLINSKTVLELYDMHRDSSEGIDAQLSKLDEDGEKKYRSETPIAKLWRQTRKIETGAVVKSRKGLIGVEGGKGTCYQWKEKASVRKV